MTTASNHTKLTPTTHPTGRRQNNRRTAQATNVGCGEPGTTDFPHSRKTKLRFAISWPSSYRPTLPPRRLRHQRTLAATRCTRYEMACRSASQRPGSPKLSGPADDPPGKLSRLLCHESSTLKPARWLGWRERSEPCKPCVIADMCSIHALPSAASRSVDPRLRRVGGVESTWGRRLPEGFQIGVRGFRGKRAGIFRPQYSVLVAEARLGLAL